jgi:hypothetical protein
MPQSHALPFGEGFTRRHLRRTEGTGRIWNLRLCASNKPHRCVEQSTGNDSLGADRTASSHSDKGHPIFTAKVLIFRTARKETAWAFHKHMKLLKGAVRQERITKKSRISGAFVG